MDRILFAVVTRENKSQGVSAPFPFDTKRWRYRQEFKPAQPRPLAYARLVQCSHFRCWHKCEVPAASSKVRVWGQSGRHILVL